MRYLFIALIYSCCIAGKAQSNDSLKAFVSALVDKTLIKGSVQYLGIYTLTGLKDNPTRFSEYITDLLAIYADHDSVVVVNRQQLKDVFEENKIKYRFPQDVKTWKKLSDVSSVQAVITGKIIYDEETKEFQLLLTIFDTSSGWIITAGERAFELTSQMTSLIKEDKAKPFKPPLLNVRTIEPQPNDDSNNNNNGTLPTNVPSGDSIPNCDENNTGDVCFTNDLGEDVKVYISDPEDNSGLAGSIHQMIIRAGKKKCINLSAKNYRFEAYPLNKGTQGWRTIDEGSFRVEKCKKVNYSIE